MEPKTQKTIAEMEAARRRRDGTLFVWVCLAILLFVGAVLAFWCSLQSDVEAARETMRIDTPAEGVGRAETFADAPLKGAAEVAESARTILRVFCETDPDLPAWWNPASAEIVYVATNLQQTCNQLATHSDALDYNLNTTLWGWNGHGMEVWEMDLFARIVYLEFWGTSRECVEAGIDSMLLLWDMGEYGRTMGELLSAQYAPGYYVYSPYAYVWDWEYNAEGLADIRAMCEERFANGPEWCAPYFRLWYYHEWATPAYEIDGVYFSVPRG